MVLAKNVFRYKRLLVVMLMTVRVFCTMFAVSVIIHKHKFWPLSFSPLRGEGFINLYCFLLPFGEVGRGFLFLQIRFLLRQPGCILIWCVNNNIHLHV